ncbi:glutamate-cysteine ligase family protein [Streptomyces chrestomyceticus]|uniref:glutamate-cysteine ligase family protein n=1 Tax=Streptomyces chrestomyceticus TaxID=68185 RepID=UPI0036A0F6C6
MKIGIESELPVVDRRGAAAGRPAVRAVFERLAARPDFDPYHDATTGTLVGARSVRDHGTLDVGNDYGVCTVEAALPPEEGFAAAKAAWHRTLDDVVFPALAAEGLSALAHGCQPLTETLGGPYLADKAHYNLWLAQAERYPGHYASDAWPGFAAVQFNVDVPLPRVIDACNTLVRMTPLIFAWGANSAVFGGRVQPWHSLRLRGYTELSETNPFFAHRLHYPRHLYGSLADYMREAWALPIFEITRHGVPHTPLVPELTTRQFAETGHAEFVDPDGTKRILHCTTADLASGLVFCWPAVRVRMRLDESCTVAEALEAVARDRGEAVLRDGGRGTFVEIRHLPTMNREETFAWLAVLLGWLGDIEGCRDLFGGWSLQDSRTAAAEVQTRGWAAEVAGVPLPEWGRRALDLAAESLRRDPVAPAEELEPLARRLRDRTSPATDAVAQVRSEGIEAFVEGLRMC